MDRDQVGMPMQARRAELDDVAQIEKLVLSGSPNSQESDKGGYASGGVDAPSRDPNFSIARIV